MISGKIISAPGINDVLSRLCLAGVIVFSALMACAAENRGLYLWRSIEIASNPLKQKDFFTVCRNNRINRIYCFISRDKDKQFYLDKFKRQFSNFLENCESRNIKVWALMGSNEWLPKSFRNEITALTANLRLFNTACSERKICGFEGLKLDIEPHGLSAWKNPQSRIQLCGQYLSVIKFVRGKIKDMPLSVDVPYTYDKIALPGRKDDLLGRKDDLLGAIFRQVSTITFMAYLNRENLILKKLQPIILRKDLNIPFQVAFETAFLKNAEPYISFYGKGLEYFYKTYNKCRKSFRMNRNFDGLVIHDFTGLKQMSK